MGCPEKFCTGVRFAWGETYAPPALYVSSRQRRTPAYVSPGEKRTPAYVSPGEKRTPPPGGTSLLRRNARPSSAYTPAYVSSPRRRTLLPPAKRTPAYKPDAGGDKPSFWGETCAGLSPPAKRTPAYVSPQEKRIRRRTFLPRRNVRAGGAYVSPQAKRTPVHNFAGQHNY